MPACTECALLLEMGPGLLAGCRGHMQEMPVNLLPISKVFLPWRVGAQWVRHVRWFFPQSPKWPCQRRSWNRDTELFPFWESIFEPATASLFLAGNLLTP